MNKPQGTPVTVQVIPSDSTGVDDSLRALAEIILAKVRDDSAELRAMLEDDVNAAAFLDFLIEILPILFELLDGAACNPEETAAGIRKVLAKPLAGYFLRRRLRRKVAEREGEEGYALFGGSACDAILAVVKDVDNDKIINIAIKARPAPIWGVFNQVG